MEKSYAGMVFEMECPTAPPMEFLEVLSLHSLYVIFNLEVHFFI